MKKDITRAIIDATIDRGLREINEDPRRSIRKFAELGRRFNKARFTKNLYDIFQDLLRNDESPYYIAIEHLLRFTEIKKLKDCGINIGYNSFTKGGKLIRKLDEEKGVRAPWDLIIRLDPTVKNSTTPSDLIPFIAKARQYGVYSYVIRLENSLDYFEDLIKLFLVYDDCAFLFVLPDAEIPHDQLNLISECSNAIYFLPAFDDSCGPNSHLLKKAKAWSGLYAMYDEGAPEHIISEDSVWDYIPQEISFLLLIANDGVSKLTIDKMSGFVKQMRLTPIAPLFLFDLYGDSMQIQSLISGREYFYEILSDGSLNTSRGPISTNEPLPNLEKLFAE